MRIARMSIIAAVFAVFPHLAAAQKTAEELVGKMQDVALYPLWPVNAGHQNYGRVGHGIEFSFSIGETTRTMTPYKRKRRCAKINAELDSLERLDYDPDAARHSRKPRRCDPRWAVDTTLELSTVALRSPLDHLDSVWTVKTEELKVVVAHYELAVASQSTTLRHTNTAQSWKLDGSVQEFPALSFYATFLPDAPIVSPYVGVRYTLADLKNVRIAQQDSVAKIDASTDGGGAVAGIVADWQRFNFFGEFGYTYLRFDTRNWSAPTNLKPIAGSFPRHLNLNGYRASFGVQISLGDDEKK